jgi:quercetin dioxygenase-like cupin family protein
MSLENLPCCKYNNIVRIRYFISKHRLKISKYFLLGDIMTDSGNKIKIRSDRSQVVEYNNPLFECFAQTSYYPANKPYHITEHWHEDLELFYILDGELGFSVNGKSIILHAGEGILVNSKRIHSNHSVPGKPCAFYCSIIHPSLLCSSKYIEQTYLAPLLGANSFDYLLLNRNDWTHVIIDEMERLFEDSDNKTIELDILESSFRIWKNIYKHVETPPTTAGPASFEIGTFKSMILFIQHHYMEKISLGGDLRLRRKCGKNALRQAVQKICLENSRGIFNLLPHSKEYRTADKDKFEHHGNQLCHRFFECKPLHKDVP